MSTVLWTNSLAAGQVTSDSSDKYAVYKHLDKLDKRCKELGLPPLSELCDSTDLRFNLDDDLELPEGMSSTNELMAQSGVWIEAGEAVARLGRLLASLKEKPVKLGFIKNDYDEVLAELEESLRFAEGAAAQGAKFNFAIVM
jgi:hypothetical protein